MENTSQERKERWLVFGTIVLYLVLTVVWHLLSNAPWDDDCIGRTYNTQQALHHPEEFISLWNRPLFVLLFVLPMQLGREGVLMMALLTALNAWFLYLAAREMKMKDAFLVVPFLLFQSFFFTISSSALTEPLAAFILTLGLYFSLREKYLLFAIVGSLLPLARLELSLLLVFWVYVLVKNRKYGYVLILGVPVLLWNLAGWAIQGDPLWLYDQTFGKENSVNRYGHRPFSHYFERYPYIVGPVVFYFFFIGFLERLYRRRLDALVWMQFTTGFFIYVVFSWKLNMGQAAGFLRHMISLSPLAALLAVEGFHWWYVAATAGAREQPAKTTQEEPLEKRIERIIQEGKKKKLPNKKIKHLVSEERKRYAEKERARAAEKASQQTGLQWRILLISGVVLLLTWAFFSRRMVFHHFLKEGTFQWRNLAVTGGITLLFLMLMTAARFHDEAFFRRLRGWMAGLTAGAVILFTMITEPPDSHDSPERQVVERFAKLYKHSFLKDFPTYVNHPYFFWITGYDKKDPHFRTITREHLEEAPDSSLILWDTHYSRRLGGDVPYSFFTGKDQYVQLFKYASSDTHFVMMGLMKFVHPDPKRVVTLFDRLLAVDSTLPGVYVFRGTYYAKYLKAPQKALEDYDRALALDSSDVMVWFNRGLVNMSLRNFDRARKDFGKAVELQPDNYQALYNIGVASLQLKEYRRAIREFERTMKVKKDYVRACLSEAFAYTQLQETDSALLLYNRVLNMKSATRQEKAGTHLVMGNLLILKGKREDACMHFIMAKRLGNRMAPLYLQKYCNQKAGK